MLNKGYNQYRENSIFTATPEELTLMLYNGLVKFILQAEMGIDEKNLEKCNNSIIRAQDIILEFQATLDKKYPVSESLNLIYDYMYRRLVEANVKKDKQILEEVLGMAKELRDTWAQAMRLARRKGQEQPGVRGQARAEDQVLTDGQVRKVQAQNAGQARNKGQVVMDGQVQNAGQVRNEGRAGTVGQAQTAGLG